MLESPSFSQVILDLMFPKIFFHLKNIIKILNEILIKINKKGAIRIIWGTLDTLEPAKDSIFFVENIFESLFIPKGGVFYKAFNGIR